MKDIKVLRQSARKGNARKAKVRKFWYLLEYYCDYDWTCYFSGNCSTKCCRCIESGQACANFSQCNTEVCENTEPLIEMRSEEDIDESFWTLMFRLWMFNLFCSHITWQNYCFFLLTINFQFDVFSSDNTFYIEIFQSNLYLISYGWTKKPVILRTSSQNSTSAWVFS